MLIDPDRIHDAQKLLAQHFPPTRLMRAASLGGVDRDVYLKLRAGIPSPSAAS
jgi:hypothetical protein